MTFRPSDYSVADYGDMILNAARMAAFDAALRQAVTPGCRVIDIGAGTGIFSLLACKYGAGHVVAIEPADPILILPEMARANGFADRITVLQGLSTDYHPAERADVVVSDLRGCLPLFERHIATIVDARERLLRPGGRLIPLSDTIRGALVQSEDCGRPVRQPWLANDLGLDLAAGHRFAANQSRKSYLGTDALVSAIHDIAVLDYATITDPNLRSRVVFRPGGAARPNGILVWFDMTTAPGIGFSNAPGQPEQVYGQTFLPFETVPDLGPDDRVEITLSARLIGDAYEWSWLTDVFRGQDDRPSTRMRQSDFRARVLSPDHLARRASGHVPRRSLRHEIDSFVLSQIDGTRPVQEIAAMVAQRYGDQVRTPQAALDLVAGLTGRYD